MVRHLTTQEIEAGLPDVHASPKDHGELVAIFTRPAVGERRELQATEITAECGIPDDHWSKGCWKSLENGAPDPDVQISLMSSRFINLIASSRENWGLSGNNIFVDLDLTPENLPIGQKLKVGAAELVITAVPYTGCAKFIERYGRDACVYVNRGLGRDMRLRGVYGRVVKDGYIKVGDKVTKLPASS